MKKDCLLCQGETVTIPDKDLPKKLCVDCLCKVMEFMLVDIVVTPMRERLKKEREHANTSPSQRQRERLRP